MILLSTEELAEKLAAIAGMETEEYLKLSLKEQASYMNMNEMDFADWIIDRMHELSPTQIFLNDELQRTFDFSTVKQEYINRFVAWLAAHKEPENKFTNTVIEAFADFIHVDQQVIRDQLGAVQEPLPQIKNVVYDDGSEIWRKNDNTWKLVEAEDWDGVGQVYPNVKDILKTPQGKAIILFNQRNK